MINIDVNNMTLYNKDIIINMCDFCFELLKQKLNAVDAFVWYMDTVSQQSKFKIAILHNSKSFTKHFHYFLIPFC